MANIYDFYGLIKNAVKYYPDGDRCHRPNTFLVQTRDLGTNLSEPNLGATICDKDKNYFYSRLWEQKGFPTAIEFEWPLVSVFAGDATVEKAFSNRPNINYQFFLNVTDVYKGATCEECDCDTCDARTINEINEDTKNILFSILAYLRNSSVYMVDGVERLFNDSHAATLANCGVRDRVKGMENMLSVQNTGALMYHTMPGENRFGTQIKFNVKFSECNFPIFDFEESDFIQQQGCKDCG